MKRAALLRDALVVLGLAACCWFGAAVSAHVRLKNPVNGNYLKWNDPSDVTVVISSSGSSDIVDGSHTPAIQNAIAAWNEVGGTTAHMREVISSAQRNRTDWESNDLHMILFDEDNSSGFFPEGSATVAVTPVWFYSSGRISDADVLFNGRGFEFTTSGEAGKFDVQDVATHELGHLMGLDHSGWAGASMYPYVDQDVTLHRSLSLDEVGGLRHAYPGGPFARITGAVVREQGGSAVAGAHVVVRDSSGRPARSFLTDNSGVFTIYGLDPGDYSLYVDPLDQPVSANNLGGGWTVETDFGSVLNGSVTVSAGETHDVGVLFVPPSTDMALGRNSDDYPLACEIGFTTSVMVRGASLFPGSLLSASDPTLVVGEPTWNGWNVTFQVTVPVGTDPGHVDLEVWNTSGELSILPAAIELVPTAPTVSGVFPAVATTIGGTDIAITGSGFRSGARVVLGDAVYADGESCEVLDEGTIRLTTTPGAEGARDVVVIDPTGVEGRKASGFSYADLPTVQSVFPDAGSSGGGTRVVVTGFHFDPGATVFIDQIQQGDVEWIDATMIEFTTLASRGAGVRALELVQPDGTRAASSFQFTLIGDPMLASCSPEQGSRFGGDLLTIRGERFHPEMQVWFGVDRNTGDGGVQASGVTWISSTTLQVLSPAHAQGYVDVLVVNPENGQADMLISGFRYSSPSTAGGGCMSVSPPVDAGSGPWVSFLLGLGLIALASKATMSGRFRPRNMA